VSLPAPVPAPQPPAPSPAPAAPPRLRLIELTNEELAVSADALLVAEPALLVTTTV